MRQRHCRVCDGWHDVDHPWPDNCLPPRNLTRSELAMPQVARTALDDVWNPVNGQRYTNSRAFERDVKAKGCEIIGNDSSLLNYQQKPNEPDTVGIEQSVVRAWDELS